MRRVPLRSSTSSSEQRRRRPLALIVLLVTLAGTEFLARTVLVSASKDLRRFAAYPDRAATLVERPEPQLAFIGNSATDEGLDLPLLEATMAAGGRAVRADEFVADASRINTWHFLLKHTFFDRGLAATAAVITFYEDDLLDGNRVEVGRLAQFFTSLEDWPSVFALDLPDLETRADFVLSSASAAVAVRGRVKERMLSVLVPDYKGFSRTVNALNLRMQNEAAPAASSAAPAGTRALERLLAMARAHGARLVFVAYPLPSAFTAPPYALDARMTALIEAAGHPLIDARNPRDFDLRPEHYVDDVHLGSEGALRFTRGLALRLLQAGVPPTR